VSTREPRATPCAPLLVSQHNCEAAVGIKPRAFREWVNRCGLPAKRLGKTILVRADLVLAALAVDEAPEPEPDDPVERLRRRVGVRLAPGGR
jgi:hypothetical protein